MGLGRTAYRRRVLKAAYSSASSCRSSLKSARSITLWGEPVVASQACGRVQEMAGRQAHGAIQTRETRQALRQVCLAGAGHGRGGPCAAAAARQRRYRTTPRPRTCISFTASGRPCTSPLTVPCSRPGACGCMAAGEAQDASPHTAPQACGC